MESGDGKKNNLSGNEGHGVHVCRKCGWSYPKPHPSARHRRAHKKICGTIKFGSSEDNKTHLDALDDEHLSDNDSKTLTTNVSENLEKMTEMTVSSRSFSGFSCGSIRSTRSEEDVFADAVTEFADASGVSDSDDAREFAKKEDIFEYHTVTELVDEKTVTDVGGGDTHNITVPSQSVMTSCILDSSSNPGLDARKAEILISEDRLQCSGISVLGPEEKGSVEEVSDKKSDNSASIPTENGGKTSDTVSMPQKVNGDISFEFVPANVAVETVEASKQSDVFDEEKDCSPKDDFDDHMKATDDVNVKADSIYVTKETLSSTSLAEPSEICFVEDISVEAIMVKDDTRVTDESGANSTVHLGKNINEVGEGKTVTEEQKPVNLQSFLDNSDNHTHSNSSVKLVDENSEYDNKDAEFSDAIEEADSLKEVDKELPPTNETTISNIRDMENNLLSGNRDGYDVKSTVAEKLSESTPSMPEFEDQMDNKLIVEKKYEHVLDAVALESSSSEKCHDGNSVSKTKDLVDISLDKKAGDKMSVEECMGKVDLGLISDNDDNFDLTQNVADSFNVEADSAVEYSFTRERGDTTCVFGPRDTKIGKQEETFSKLDIQADSVTQTDSLEGNRGSFSGETALSTLSESLKAQKAILQPKSNNGESAIIKPPTAILSAEQRAYKSDQNEGAPSTETSLTSVANESSGKQHMPLKSYLGESSSPSAKINPPPKSQETVKMVMDTKELLDDTIKGELGKEWNSPARYPANIKREKGKVKRPYWAPFICCSSVQTS